MLVTWHMTKKRGNAELRLEDVLIIFLYSVHQIEKYCLDKSTNPIIKRD